LNRGGNSQGVKEEGEDWRWEKRAAMAAQAVEARRRCWFPLEVGDGWAARPSWAIKSSWAGVAAWVG
jgi:hypothetical protein